MGRCLYCDEKFDGRGDFCSRSCSSSFDADEWDAAMKSSSSDFSGPTYYSEQTSRDSQSSYQILQDSKDCEQLKLERNIKRNRQNYTFAKWLIVFSILLIPAIAFANVMFIEETGTLNIIAIIVFVIVCIYLCFQLFLFVRALLSIYTSPKTFWKSFLFILISISISFLIEYLFLGFIFLVDIYRQIF